MDKFWKTIENSHSVSKTMEIMSITYTNRNFTCVEDIKEAFDQWSETDIESVLNEIKAHPTYEESDTPDYSFGDVGLTYFWSDFYESATVRDSPMEVWHIARPPKGKKFF